MKLPEYPEDSRTASLKKRVDGFRVLLQGHYPAFLLGILLALASVFSLLSFRQRHQGEVFSLSNNQILGERAGSVSAVSTSSAVVEPFTSAWQVSSAADKNEPSLPPSDATQLININTATAAQLDILPGIGPVTAAKIIDLRNRLGRFTNVDQLLDVSGIGEKKLAKIRDRVTLGR